MLLSTYSATRFQFAAFSGFWHQHFGRT